MADLKERPIEALKARRAELAARIAKERDRVSPLEWDEFFEVGMELDKRTRSRKKAPSDSGPTP